jgi:catechol 2,3-dioxygenase-like lactoylglutathione lyase family enzyme
MTEPVTHGAVAIIACRDIGASTAFYCRLGFSVQSDYGRYRILSDGRGWNIHLSGESPAEWIVPGENPHGIYLYTQDVDGLAARVGDLIGAGPEHKPWGMYEFALSDPDGTLVRIGCPTRSFDLNLHAKLAEQRSLKG